MTKKKFPPFKEYKLPGKPETFWAYLAGIIDGDGYLKIMRRKSNQIKRGWCRQYILAISIDAPGFLEKLQEDIGFGHLIKYPIKGKDYIYPEIRFWSGALRVLLPKVIPYLRVKKRLAEIIVEAMKLVTKNYAHEAEIQKLEEQFNYEFYDVIHREYYDNNCRKPKNKSSQKYKEPEK